MPCTDFFRLQVVRLEEQLPCLNAFSIAPQSPKTWSSNLVGLVSGIQLKGLKPINIPRLTRMPSGGQKTHSVTPQSPSYSFDHDCKNQFTVHPENEHHVYN